MLFAALMDGSDTGSGGATLKQVLRLDGKEPQCYFENDNSLSIKKEKHAFFPSIHWETSAPPGSPRRQEPFPVAVDEAEV